MTKEELLKNAEKLIEKFPFAEPLKDILLETYALGYANGIHDAIEKMAKHLQDDIQDEQNKLLCNTTSTNSENKPSSLYRITISPRQ